MHFPQLALLGLFTTVLASPLPDIETRQARTAKLTFYGANYKDFYYVDVADGQSVKITNPLSVSKISLGGGALCTANGADGSVTTLNGLTTVDVGPPQRQISVTCITRG